MDLARLAGKVIDSPSRDDVDITLSEQLIVEFYSR
jgi:ribosomal protein S4